MSGFQNFSFGDGDQNIGSRTKRFKAEGGNTYRVSFGWWEGTEDSKPVLEGAPKFTGAQTHFIPNVGYVVSNGPEYIKIAGDQPRTRIGTLLFVWPTAKDGTLDKARMAKGEVEVLPWVFSGDKYKRLQLIHKEFPLCDHDITMSCTDTQYQKIDFSPCKENLFKKMLGNEKAKDLVDKILEDSVSIVGAIQDSVGREMTIEQIREKLAGSGNASASSAASAVTAAVSSEDIDSMVGDLLD